MPTLADMSPGQSAEVLSVSGDPALVQRLYEFGLLEGERIEVLATAHLRCTISTPSLVLNEGAVFDGDCKMPREKAAA